VVDVDKLMQLAPDERVKLAAAVMQLALAMGGTPSEDTGEANGITDDTGAADANPASALDERER
jgi:hypothetical protein